MKRYSYSGSRKKYGPLILAVAVLVFFFGAYHACAQMYQYFLRSSDADSVAFEVAEGESCREIAKRLAAEDIIPSAWWFCVSAKIAGLDDDIRAGRTFVVPKDRSADILGALVYPADTSEVSMTIPEGYTLAQMGDVVRAQLPHITQEDWARVTGISSPFVEDAFVRSAQKPDGVDLEGYLFPDTYRFFFDATAEDVVERMVRTMESRVASLGVPTGDAEGFTTHELLTLASIIEREVRAPSDMKEVADIFLKRLDIGMALQSDATVNYVTGGTDPSLSLTDRDTDTPYNTYIHPGLPPGPISNPGLSALHAVWNPAENPYYYFLTDASGMVYYATTHEEHVINKANHL